MKYARRKEGNIVKVVNITIDGPTPDGRGKQEKSKGSTGSPDYSYRDEDERCFVLSNN